MVWMSDEIILFPFWRYKMKKLIATSIMMAFLSACSSMPQGEQNYPKTRDEIESERVGKLTGEDGIVLFGKKKRSKGDSSEIVVNGYLWRASLDVVHNLPLASTDPFGGTIITDWYQAEANSSEKLKLNIFILGGELRSDAIKVTSFKQVRSGNGWADKAGNAAFDRKLEEEILLKARELKVGIKKFSN
jgi:hypothetical protein